MAESHKFKDLNELTTTFPEVPWKASAGGDVWVFNEKEEDYVPVQKGQFVVKVADRYEVHDEEPAKAKPAEAPKEDPKETPKAQPDSDTVSPEKIGTKPAEGK